MMREYHVRICERLGVKFPGSTRQNEPYHSLRRHGRSTSDCMSFPEEATHPRYYGEGYPDWPGRASNKEGESWTSIAGLSSESIRQSCAMRLRSRRMVVTDSAIRRFESSRPSQPVRGPFRRHGLRFIPETPFSNFRFDMPQTGSIADRYRLANENASPQSSAQPEGPCWTEMRRGLSPTAIIRLKDGWLDEHDAWQKHDLSAKRYMDVWADGIYLPTPRRNRQSRCPSGRGSAAASRS